MKQVKARKGTVQEAGCFLDSPLKTGVFRASPKALSKFQLALVLAGISISAMTFPGCAVYGTGTASRPAAAGMGEDGLYEGTAQGWRGPVRVLLRLEDGAIAEIEIIDHEDDEFIGGAAMEELLELVLAYNTTDLDAVSGATESSEGFLAALEDALGREAQIMEPVPKSGRF
jgi:uncharacterized protein with FMN-binding domain